MRLANLLLDKGSLWLHSYLSNDIQGEFIFNTLFGRLRALVRLQCDFTAMRRSATSFSRFAVQSVAQQHYPRVGTRDIVSIE